MQGSLMAAYRSHSIPVLIAAAPICSDCLALRTGMSRQEVSMALQDLAATTLFRTTAGRCERCLREKLVHRIG